MAEDIAAKVETFFSKYRPRQYAKGQILILNGDTTDYIYYIKSGKVKEYEVSYKGDEIILNIFKQGSFFPMSLAINKVANPYIYEAETDIEVHQAPAGEVLDYVKNNPDVMFDLLSRLYRGIDGLLARMARLMSSSAKGRLMFEISLECRRFGETNKNGACTIKISESDLAARAGLSRETVSREMHKLVNNKLLALKNGAITIFDIGEFEKKLTHIL